MQQQTNISTESATRTENNIKSSDAITHSTISASSSGSVADDTLPFSSTSSDSLNHINGDASENLFTRTSLTDNTNTKANQANSAATEPDSNATESAVSNTQNHDYTIAFATDRANWSSSGTTQERGGGNSDGDGGKWIFGFDDLTHSPSRING